jgi:hypothetical protein
VESVGLSPVDSIELSPVDSVELSPVDSVGLSPVDSVGLSPVESCGPLESIGLVHRNPPEKYGWNPQTPPDYTIFWWTPPDSTGLLPD